MKSNQSVINIHASCISLEGKGVLLLGKSGSGKSDLALRLIENKNAKLVADDRVNLFVENGRLFASAPDIIAGMIEVRGVGIINIPCVGKTEISLAVDLVENFRDLERLPKAYTKDFLGFKINGLRLYPFETSAVDKIVIKMKAGLD